MSGRGRGRGKGFAPKKTGFGTEDVPPPLNQPPPIYPQLLFNPVPLVTGKKMEYLLALKQEIRSSFRESGYYVQPVSVKKDIERYTDKYEHLHAADQIPWDKAHFPKELFAEPQRKRKKNIKTPPKKEIAIVEKLEVLEEKEKKEEGGEEEEEKEEEMVEEEDNEEELEEETDYASNYFDNGENYLDEDDDNPDEGYEY